MQRVVIGLVLLFLACGKGSSGGGVAVVPGAPAGDVTEIAGDVHATRDGKTRALAKGDVVSGDDVVATGADGRVTIVLRHNQVPWSLGPNKEKKVADSAAWAAAKGASGENVSDDHSTAAGRHAERSATDTTATAESAPAAAAPAPTAMAPPPVAAAPAPTMPEPAPAPAPAPPEAPAPPPPPKTASRSKGAPPDSINDSLDAPGAFDSEADGLRVGTSGGGGAPAPGEGGGVAVGAPREAGPRGRINIGSFGVTGALTKDQAERVVKARLGIFRACYQRELQRNPTIAGMLSITIEVKPDGSVAHAKVDGGQDADAVRSCIQSQIGRLKFPTAADPSTISAKMILSPSDG
ncbi:MAG TPA: AgmX/PglI C-terminal domain-containing protein [Kofleriaceae bacterium]|jgi:hypothetical protein|nr:AgmX/PglI C-terminal domain-containing protein [Kofleriaceae bacterium]